MTVAMDISGRKEVQSMLLDPARRALLARCIELAVQEDLGASGREDLTTNAVVSPHLKAEAIIYCKQAPVLVAGLWVIKEVFGYLDDSLKVNCLVEEGVAIDRIPQAVASISGRAASILSGERIALNLLQRISGIATLTRQFVERANPVGIKILDTRKTAPGLRLFEKYGVLAGGGVNHRFGLESGLIVKDNHIEIAGGISEAIGAVSKAHPELPIEVECASLAQVEECLNHKVATIMLDNMTPSMVRSAVALIKGRCQIEVSGSINLANLDDYLIAGVDAISVGALTHSAKSIDLSLEVRRFYEE
jgi:nicotinate-nucleotide pyrophosphorylase (carboxylating)